MTSVLERVAGRRLQFAVRFRDGGRWWPAVGSPAWVVGTAAFLRDAGAKGAR